MMPLWWCIYIHTYPHTYLPTYIPTYIHTYIPLHYLTLHYLTLPYITLPYIAYIHTYIHTITYHYIPLHTITYHYIPLHTIKLHYITLHYLTLPYITLPYLTLHTYIRTYQHTNIPPPQATGGGPEEPYHHHRPQGGGTRGTIPPPQATGGGTRRTIPPPQATGGGGPEEPDDTVHPYPLVGGEGGWPTLHHIYNTIYIYIKHYIPYIFALHHQNSRTIGPNVHPEPQMHPSPRDAAKLPPLQYSKNKCSFSGPQPTDFVRRSKVQYSPLVLQQRYFFIGMMMKQRAWGTLVFSNRAIWFCRKNLGNLHNFMMMHWLERHVPHSRHTKIIIR